MTPSQFRDARREFDLTQSQVALLLNVDRRTIRKWEHEKGYGPHPTAALIFHWMKTETDADGYPWRPPSFYLTTA